MSKWNKNFYIAHFTTSAGDSLKAQQILTQNNILFIQEIQGCILLKVRKGELDRAKKLIKNAAEIY